jgi:hypothetical protein
MVVAGVTGTVTVLKFIVIIVIRHKLVIIKR